jgi:hypothetical protein
MKVLTIMSISLVMAITSCAASYTKEGYLNNFKAFVTEVETQTYTPADWTRVEAEYQHYTGDFYEKYRSKFTDDDLHTIGVLEGRYQAVFLRHEGNRMMQDAADGLKQLGGFVEGLLGSDSTEVQPNPNP